MKGFKKKLAVILSLLIFFTPTMSAMTTLSFFNSGEKCEYLNVMVGVGNGVDEEYLKDNTSRLQGAIILLRLLGKEDEAKNFIGSSNFTDVIGYEQFVPILAYLKANPQYGFGGYEDGSFNPDKIMTVAELYKVLMTILGYEQDVDYIWEEVMVFANDTVGLTAFSNGSQVLTNADTATAIIEALQLMKKDKTGTLIEFLIAEGVIDAIDADTVGLISKLAIISAKATNVNEITVTFNKQVEEGTEVTLKNGLATIYTTRTWNEKRTQLIISRYIPFSSGIYQVFVGDLAPVDVPIVTEVAMKAIITNTAILKDANASFNVKLYNQYGKEMKVSERSDFTITAFNKTTCGTLFVYPDFFAINTAGCKENDIVTFTVMHNASTVVGRFDLSVVEESVVSKFDFIGYQVSKDKDRVETGDLDVIIDYIAYDQYGNIMQLKSKEGITFVSSNSSIVDTSTLNFTSKGVLSFDAGVTKGTVTLSALVNGTGSISSISVTVYAPASTNTIIIGDTADLVVSGESTEINYIAKDQFGNELEKDKNGVILGVNGLTFVSSKDSIVSGNDFYIDNKGVLTVKPVAGAGTVTIYYYWQGILIDSFTLDVNAKAKPVVVESVSYNNGIELGAQQVINISDLTVLDQYGRVFDTKDLKTTSFKIIQDNDFISIDSNDKFWTFKAGETTTGTVKFTIGIAEEGKLKENSETVIPMTVFNVYNNANKITYLFIEFPKLYANTGFTNVEAAGPYAKPISIVGMTADGTVISLKQDKIFTLTSSDPGIKVGHINSPNVLQLLKKDTYDYCLYAVAETTSIIRAYDKEAKLLCEMEVTSSKERNVQSVKFGDSVTISESAFYSVSNDMSVPYYNTVLFTKEAKTIPELDLKITDEYGVNMLKATTAAQYNLMECGFFTSSAPDMFVVDQNGYITSNVNKDTKVMLTYTTNTGLQDSIEITIKDDLEHDISLADVLMLKVSSLDDPSKNAIFEDGSDFKVDTKNYSLTWKDAFISEGESIKIEVFIKGIPAEGVQPLLIARMCLDSEIDMKDFPIGFYIISNPEIRVRQQHLYGISSVDVTNVINTEFILTMDDVLVLLINDNFNVVDVSRVLQVVYVQSDIELATTLQNYNYSANQITESVRIVCNMDEEESAKTLDILGFAADVISQAMKDIFNLTGEATAYILDNLNYGAEEIAKIMKDIFNLTGEATAYILDVLNYGAEEIAQLMKDIYELTGDATAYILDVLGYAADTITGIMKSVYNLGSEATAAILKGLGYTADIIAGAMKSVYNLGAEATAAVLKGLGYAADTISGIMKSVYNLSAEATAAVLNGLGYAADVITNIMIDLYELGSDAIGNILGGLGYAKDFIEDLLGNIFGTVICTELYRQGYLTDEIYQADRKFGQYIDQKMPLVRKGYQFLAAPIVRRMQESEDYTKTVYIFAKPWAEQMAYRAGALDKGNGWGIVIMIIGVPLCFITGVILTFGYNTVTLLLLIGAIYFYKKRYLYYRKSIQGN